MDGRRFFSPKGPFRLAELVARIKARLRIAQAAHQMPRELVGGPLRVNTESRRAYLNDEELDLTSKEYALLEYMMRHPNETLTRSMIAEHVWDYTFDSFTNIIDVYVNYLRKKVDRDFDRKLIHTVRGVGYVLRES